MAPVKQIEHDFPAGHPGRADYDPNSREAAEWVRKNVTPLGERDFPVDHIKAADTPGNSNAITWQAGVDPLNPHREPHTGRTPEQAAGVAAINAIASKAAVESPVLQPLDAHVVANALNEKRRELKRDVLTPEEYASVMAELQSKPKPGEDPEAAARKIAAQHQALAVLMSRGYQRQTAIDMIALEGAEKVLARFPAQEKGA